MLAKAEGDIEQPPQLEDLCTAERVPEATCHECKLQAHAAVSTGKNSKTTAASD